MRTCMSCAQAMGVWLALLFASFSVGSEASGDVSSAPSWVLLDFTLQPPAAVFLHGDGQHFVGIGADLPGAEARLQSLSRSTALIAVQAPDGRELLVALARGQALDIEEVLRKLDASVQSDYPAIEIVADSPHAE